jgi:prenyltransferase beta subunit
MKGERLTRASCGRRIEMNDSTVIILFTRDNATNWFEMNQRTDGCLSSKGSSITSMVDNNHPIAIPIAVAVPIVLETIRTQDLMTGIVSHLTGCVDNLPTRDWMIILRVLIL